MPRDKPLGLVIPTSCQGPGRRQSYGNIVQNQDPVVNQLDSTLSVDIDKLHRRMIPEPRERYHSAHYYCYLFKEDKV